MPTMDHIRIHDGVVVHGWLVCQGQDGSWWATHDRSIRCANDRDRLLLKIAEATGQPPDLNDLRGRLDRAIESARRMRAEDELLEVRRNGQGQGEGRRRK